MLDDCDAAIAAIETGAQAWTNRGKQVQHAQLRDLYAQRERLLKIVAQPGQMASLGVILRPS